MAHQGHHADQVEDPDEDVGHVGELWPVGAGGRSKKEREKEKNEISERSKNVTPEVH